MAKKQGAVMFKNKIRQFNEFPFQKIFNNYSAAISFGVTFIALLVLIGWQFDVAFLKRPIEELDAMNPMTAIILLFSGVSLYLQTRMPQKTAFAFGGKLIAAIVGLIGLLKLLSFFSPFDAGVDRWFYSQKIAADLLKEIPNSMTLNTAANFVLIATALLLLKSAKKEATIVSNFIVLITGFTSLLSIVAYSYGAESFSGFFSFFPMDMHSAVCFLLLSIGILIAESDKGFMATFTGAHRGRQVIELLLPTAIVVPIFLGLLRLYGEKSGMYSTSFGTAIFATANIVIFVFLILKSAVSLNKADRTLLKEMEERKKMEAALKENNIFLNTILQNVPNIIFVKDAKQLRFIHMNKDGEALLGVSRKDIIGRNDHDLFPAEQADYFAKTDRELFENNYLLDIPEERITTKHGERWLHTKKIPIIDDEGVPQYLVGISEDITERKLQSDKIKQFYKELELKVQERTEELFKSEQRFKALLENSIDGISLVNVSGEILYQSPSVERMTGHSFPGPGKESVSELLHPEEKLNAKNLLLNLVQNPTSSLPLLFRVRHILGHYIWIEGTATNRLEDKSVETIVLNYRDITEKKLAEEALAGSEEKYRMLFGNNPLPVWVFDIDTLRFLEVNEAAIRHYGYSREEFLRMTIMDLRPLEDVDTLNKVRTTPAESFEMIYHGNWRHRKKSGEIIHVDITSRHMDYKGSLARFVLANDITEKIEAEKKLNALNEELTQRAKELAASNKDLEQFAYVASHDLQEPLRMVSSFLQLLEKKYADLLDVTAKQYIHFAVDGSERMKKLILDLLTYSRAGTSKEISALIDMNEIAKEVTSTFTFTLKESEGQIIIHQLPCIVAVKAQMQQLLQNLVSNAIKYNKNHPSRIDISCQEEELFWIFKVADNGLGIDPRFFDKIFVIFQRLHNKSEYSGTGIGLAICKKIVERHGGSIHVESEPGSGSTFIFSIKKV